MAATLVTSIGLPRSGMYKNILGALEILGRRLNQGASNVMSGAASLFFNNEQGLWLDPSDLSTLFQDSAGTTPVTAVEQPVGKILDKSGRGNHATQATSASRPILRQDANGKYYLFFDGVDDSLATAAINFTSTDKMTVFAGVRKLSDVSNQLLMELSASSTTNAGAMFLFCPRDPGTYNFGLSGTVAGSRITGATFSPPISNVLTCAYDITPSALVDEIKPRVNGIIPTMVTKDVGPAGTGNFGNYPLYIGRRGGTTLPFNGHLYSLIVRGAQSTDSQIASAESYVNSKTGAY
jgi:hypothetical protein